MFALIAPAIMGALGLAMASLVGRAILALGIGFTTYKGVSVVLDSFKASAVSSVSSIGGDAMNLLGFLWIDKAMTVIFSAVVASMTLRLVGGSVKKMVFK